MLASHEILKGLLANGEIFFDFLKGWVNVFLVAEVFGELGLVAIGQDLSHLLVNGDESLTLLWEFLLHLLGVHEERLKETPGSLHVADKSDDVRDLTELLLPLDDFFFEGSQVA